MEGKDYSGLKYTGGMTFDEYCKVNEEIYRGDPLLMIQLDYDLKHSKWKAEVDCDEIEAGFKRIEDGNKRLDIRIKELNDKIDRAEKGLSLTCEVLSLT